MNVWIFFYIITNIEKNNKWEKIYSNIFLYILFNIEEENQELR